MDFQYYAILAVVVLVVLIGALSYVNDVSKWGPDLTDEMPVYLIAESLARFNKKKPADVEKQLISTPSKPCLTPTAPLLEYYRGTSSVATTPV